MSDLPTKQGILSRIGNSIIDIGLRNNFTRSIMVNTFPAVFGYRLTNFVINKDNENLNETIQLLSSMSLGAVKENFASIRYAMERKFGSAVYFTNQNERAAFVNRMLDNVTGKVAEHISLEILKRNCL